MARYIHALRLAVLLASACVLSALTANAESNLVANGNLATAASGDAGRPRGWAPDHWGTMAANFAYPVAGADGSASKGARIVVTDYQNGSAEWAFAPVLVTPGRAYTFSDTYAATVDSEIVARYKLPKVLAIAGECSPDSDANYVDCYEVVSLAVPPSSGFRGFSAVISPPKGAVSVVVFHMLVSTGMLTIADTSIVAGVSPAVAYSQAIVSLTFDDGYLDHYTNVLQIFEAAHTHGTFYVIPDDISLPDNITTPQMLALQTAGNDIASHSSDHCDLVALYKNPNSATMAGRAGAPGVGCPDQALSAAATAQTQIASSKAQLQNMGASPVNNFAYPFGSYNSAVKQLVRNAGFLAARTIDQGYNTKASDPYSLAVQNLDDSTSLGTIQSWIDTAMTNKVWLILVFHQIEADRSKDNDSYAETPALLRGVVNYLAEKRACVLTVGEAISNAPCS
jgi:peptidoglycan/xylan/chitin deacetylase (PgdA/CDA1 family)